MVAIFRALHIVAAALWIGAGVFQVLIIGPALMQAGPQAGGFIMTLARRGGMGRFFAISGIVTILAGGLVYGERIKALKDIGEGAFSSTDGFYLVTIGAILAVLALLHGLTSNMPTERKLVKLCKSIQGAPTPEQARLMGEYGAKLGKQGVIGVAIITVALLCMVGARVVAAM